MFNRLFRRAQLGSVHVFAFSALILLLSIFAQTVQAADPPQVILDKACTDDQAIRQIREKWNTLDQPIRDGITRYWNDRASLDREEALRAQRDIDYNNQWRRDKRLLQNNLLKIAGKAAFGGAAKAAQKLLEKLPTEDPVSEKLKEMLDDVLKEIQKQGETSNSDLAIIANNIRHVRDDVNKIAQNRAEWEYFKRLKTVIKEFDEIIIKAVPKPLTLELDPNVLRGDANTPIPVTVRVSGGCPPYTIAISNPDSSLFDPVTITRTRDTNIDITITFKRPGIFDDNIAEVTDDKGNHVQMKFTAHIEDPAKKASIKVQKVASASNVKPRETVTYLYTVTNTGRVQVESVLPLDDKCSPVTYVRGGTNHASNRMDPGETWEYECTTTLTTTTENTITVEAYSTAAASLKVTDKATAKVTVGICPPPKIPVPYLIYMPEDDALEELKKNKLKGRVIRREYTKDFEAGTVMDQNPAAGECVDPDSTVDLVISLGPEPEKPVEEKPAKLTMELDCGDSFELAPGDFPGRHCGIIVRGWRSKTQDPVVLTIEYDRSSGIEVSPGDVSEPPGLMYTAGVSDTYDRYVFGETFRANDNAPAGTTTVAITVRQAGAGEVTKLIKVAVLAKGLLPSAGPGIRPPPDVKQGSGGPYCVWRYKLFGDEANCFHFWAPPCTTRPPGPAYELVGQNMSWGEADARIEELSRYFKDGYGCETSYQPDCSQIAGSSAVLDKAAGKVTCLCPPDKVKNKAETACITDPDKQVAETDCSGQTGTVAKWDPDTEQVRCECPEGTTWYNNACMTDKDIKMAQTDCGDMLPQWNPETQQVDCICPAGTTLFKNSCLNDKDLKMAQANCVSPPGSVAQWNDATQQVDCVCPPDRRLYQNACMTEQEIAVLAATGTITAPQADCSDFPGTSPKLNPATGKTECVCPSGTKWYNNACVSDSQVKLAQADCSSMPGTSPRLNSSTGQVECVCPSGTKWYNNACVSDSQVKLAQADCSSMPGTTPRLNSSTGQVECVCPSGTKWYNNSCVSDSQVKLAQADCSGMPGTSPRLNSSTGQVECVCPSGTKWFNSSCVSDSQVKLAQADCSGMPGTSPQLNSSGQVVCVCPSGTKWYNNACVSDSQVKLAQADCSSMPGTSPRLNSSTGQVECVCPPGTRWFNSACRTDQEINPPKPPSPPQPPPAQIDCRSLPGTTPQRDPATGQIRCVCPTGTRWINNACRSDKVAAPPPPKPPAPPKPQGPPPPPPPTKSGSPCDPPICTDLCMRNCDSMPNAMGGNCSASCNLVPKCGPAEKEAAKSLAKVKAACYSNALKRCNQGQSGGSGGWCVGPGAEKTCVAKAHTICGCDPKTHPQCGGQWAN